MSALRNPNRRMAQAVVEELGRCGVTDACVSPGSRSTPLALALDAAPGIHVFVVGDERCAAFFALGVARERKRPTLLLCTSGTAAANYLPAVVEASLSDVPLIVVTADRPPELRDCGAPQTITQVGLFAAHVRWSVDVPAPSADVDLERYYRTLACRAAAAAMEPPAGPVHVNLPMREPLFDPAEEEAVALEPVAAEPFVTVHPSSAAAAPATVAALLARLGRGGRGLIICGPGTDHRAAPAIGALARALAWPILADPISGLRFGAHDRSQVADAYDVLLRDREFRDRHRPETILQIGALPASKPLARFLEASPRLRHAVVAPPRHWPDPLHRASDVVRADAAELCATLAARLPARTGGSTWLADWLDSSRALRAALDHELSGLDAEILEGRIFPTLVERLPPETLVILGNSMPVRDADTFLGSGERPIRFAGNRGASGIDGQLSTALGAAAARREPTVLVVGDLGFLHDLGGLQIAARHRIPLLVVVVNNDGGGIFSFLPQVELARSFETLFGTPHGLDLEPAVGMCGGRCVRARSWYELAGAIDRSLGEGDLRVVELVSDRAQNRALHERVLSAALARARLRRESAA
jgi:2-succinyl-5-enolpyruvyl-6-hydroxy-3-cyclohexene-1-carboxylate synthase